MKPDHYRMQHRAITCRACIQLDGKPVPADARDWLKPSAGHAMFLTRQGPMKACDLGTLPGAASENGHAARRP